ncbi:helix-turn-helix domain-containing protein [Streptomyces sp. NPDC002669]|uniref:helix-turn-helix domain-containing protein n=1 Tax=Streptomyces sp. NPDC002669 TaxID=3364658 RepID=UPI0036CC459F
MSNLWSGQPVTIRLDDLDIICEVLGCQPNNLLAPEPEKSRKHVRPSGGRGRAPQDRASGRSGGTTTANLRPRPCKQCGDKVAEYGWLRCFSCLHPELPPPACKACGSDAHYVSGYCRRCHPRMPYADS